MKNKRKKKIFYSTVSLPEPLVKKIKKTIKGSGYVSVSDFVTDILRTALIGKGSKKSSKKEKRVFSKEDEERVKARLKGLGYI